MALFTARARENLVRALHRDLRLLLPADPGRERLLDYVRLFDPRARLAGAGRINVDNEREVYLTRVSVIAPDVAAEARVPAGMTAAFFVQNITRGVPFSTLGPMNSKGELYDMSVRLVHGLAVRMGGIAWPDAPVLDEPLRATVYTFREVSAAQVYEIAASYAPGLAPYANPSLGSIDVSTWRTQDRQFEAQHWPRGTTSVLLPHAPRSVGDDLFYHRNDAWAVRLELSTPANRTDPGTARLLGECALTVAAASGGVCVDQLGFRVRQPGELVFR
jgi:hypothetical protein